MKKITIFFAFLFFVSFQAAAQLEITGTVTNATDGSPIPGVSIVVKSNTSIGTSTDIDGNYSLTIPESSNVLMFSSIGMKSKEVEIAGRSVINVQLEEEVLQMDEVIVVAYGTIKKGSFTGSASVVDEDELKKITTPSVGQALMGSTPGVQVTSASGQPGSQATIRIRGTGSLLAGSSPLYVVDGIPVSTGNYSDIANDSYATSSDVLSTLNQNDIESITVLKDAAAASLYGSAAANGVVLITTKKGKEGESKINFDAKYGYQSLGNERYDLMSSDEIYKIWFDNYLQQAQANGLANPVEYANSQTITALGGHNPYNVDNPLDQNGNIVSGASNVINTDWRDVVFDTGKTQDYSLRASGGSEKINYYASGGYSTYDGIAVGSDFERFTGKLNLSSDMTDFLRFGMENTLGYTVQNTPPGGGGGASPYRMSLLYNNAVPFYVVDENGNPVLDSEGNKQYNYVNPVSPDYNPVGLSKLNIYRTKTYRAISSLWMELDVLENLKFKSIGNVDYIGLTDYRFYNPYHGDGKPVSGRGSRWPKTDLNWTISNTLTYDKQFAEAHNVNFLLGYEAFESNYERINVDATGFYVIGDILFPELDNASTPEDAGSYTLTESKSSVFSRLNYDYNSKYYFSASLRRDGSSKFGSEKRYGLFYSLSGSWRISEEAFMDSFDWLSGLKLRASYGTSGNDNISNFAFLGLYSPQSYNDMSGLIHDQLANDKLHWEANANLNIGLDVTLFNRLSFTYEYYNRKSTDLLYDRPLPLSTGFGSIITNLADLKNYGHEFELNYNILRSDVVWNVGFNLSKNTNEILEILSSQIDPNDGTKRWEEGGSIYEFYLEEWAGVNSSTGEPQWYMDDGNGNKVVTSNYNEATRYKQGVSTPDFFGALNSDLSYKGFELSLMFYYSIGGQIYDDVERQLFYNGDNKGNNMTNEANDYWSTDNTDAKYPRFDVDGGLNSYNRSTLFLHDATYIKLKNIQLAYNIPQDFLNKINFSSMKLYVSAENVFVWMKDKDLKVFDPEMGIGGVNFFRSPSPRVFSFGINVGL